MLVSAYYLAHNVRNNFIKIETLNMHHNDTTIDCMKIWQFKQGL